MRNLLNLLLLTSLFRDRSFRGRSVGRRQQGCGCLTFIVIIALIVLLSRSCEGGYW